MDAVIGQNHMNAIWNRGQKIAKELSCAALFGASLQSKTAEFRRAIDCDEEGLPAFGGPNVRQIDAERPDGSALEALSRGFASACFGQARDPVTLQASMRGTVSPALIPRSSSGLRWNPSRQGDGRRSDRRSRKSRSSAARQAIARQSAERGACTAPAVDRSGVRKPIRPDDSGLRTAIKAVAAERRRFGCPLAGRRLPANAERRRIQVMLKRPGIVMTVKKLRRLCREEKLRGVVGAGANAR